ncbi:MAG TPA: polymer-forming cytoskeletal protein [Actinomycetota bacterium]|nr:polymer-forming cytoskeletal protein [Actinomycetota bacterium]
MDRLRRHRDHGQEPEEPPAEPPDRLPAATDQGEPPRAANGREERRRGREGRIDRSQDGSDLSVVSRGTRIEGTVAAAGSLRVDGDVKGKITAAKEVSLSPGGRVEANIEATDITLGGQVMGNLEAKGDVSLPADSRLDGNIRARNVQIGGEVKGDVEGRGTVELGPSARVEGDIRSKRLAIAAGAVFIGSSAMDESG